MINIPGLLWLLLYLLPFAYFVALVDYMVAFFTDSPRAKRLAYPLLVTSVVLNVVYFAVFTAYFEHIPMVSVHQVFGAVGLAIAATYTFVERRSGNPHTGTFVLFMVLICQVVNATYPRLDHYVPERLQSVLFSFHVSAAVLGYSAFALAAIYALMYLLLYDSMRTKTFGLFFQRLPALVVLDRMNFYAAIVGFAFFSVSMLLGFIWSAVAFDKMRIDPKIGVAVLTWLLYLFSILGRQYRSWRGPRLAVSSLVGFVVVLFSMFAVNLFFTKFHLFV